MGFGLPPQRRIEHHHGLRKEFNVKNSNLVPLRSRKCSTESARIDVAGGGARGSAARRGAQPRAAGSGVGAGSKPSRPSPSCGGSIVTFGSSRSSQRGMYQVFSPRRVKNAGTS